MEEALRVWIGHQNRRIWQQVLDKGKTGYVYFLRNNKYIKIGCTRYLDQRISQLQAEFPGAEVLHTIPCDDIFIAERRWHGYFRDKHYKKEWFELTDEDIQSIQTIGRTGEFGDLITDEYWTQLDFLNRLQKVMALVNYE